MATKHAKYQLAMKAFGKAMRHHRAKLGLSQEALADRAQLDRSYMSQIERGIKNVTLNSIWRIAAALDVSPSELLRLTEELQHTADAPQLEAPLHAELEIPARGGASAVEDGAARGGVAKRLLLSPSKATVLVCDDDHEICTTFEGALREAGFQTVRASSGFDAMRVLVNVRVDAVVTDVRMANGNGVELLDSMRQHYPKVPVYFMTGYSDMTEEDAIRRGARGLFCKPFDLGYFATTLRSALPV